VRWAGIGNPESVMPIVVAARELCDVVGSGRHGTGLRTRAVGMPVLQSGMCATSVCQSVRKEVWVGYR